MVDIKHLVAEQGNLIINTRRNLHRIPEPAFNEEKTSAYVIEYLKKIRIPLKTGIARFGVVGLLEKIDLVLL